MRYPHDACVCKYVVCTGRSVASSVISGLCLGHKISFFFFRGAEGEKENNFIFICKIRIIFTGILWRKLVNSSKVRVNTS